MSRYADRLPSPGKNTTVLRQSGSTDGTRRRRACEFVVERENRSSLSGTVLLLLIVNPYVTSWFSAAVDSPDGRAMDADRERPVRSGQRGAPDARSPR